MACLLKPRLGSFATPRSHPAERAFKSLRVRVRLSQCRGCGTFAPARMREQAASESPVALAISLSENASSFGAISHLNRASSR